MSSCENTFILTICFSFKICNLNEKSQGVPFLFSFLRICVQASLHLWIPEL